MITIEGHNTKTEKTTVQNGYIITCNKNGGKLKFHNQEGKLMFDLEGKFRIPDARNNKDKIPIIDMQKKQLIFIDIKDPEIPKNQIIPSTFYSKTLIHSK